MDLAKLAEMAEESQNKFNDKILHICDPNKIAAELMKSLERAAVKAANNGEYTATASYELSFWEADEDPDSHRYFNEVKRGFLSKVKSGDEKRFCATLIEMLEECIVNKNIHLELKKYDKQSATHFKFSTSIQATLSWAENAYEGNPFETIEKFKKATPESNEDEKQKLAVKRERISKYQGCVSVGAGYTFGLKTDGTIVVRKERQSDHCNVSDWRDI
ncbi:MAG: hypothetical protein FWH20_10705, partial [Oscillospiraceae bacterium]|nr:hypothetical protein [Oscillospiraceae bacterium]